MFAALDVDYRSDGAIAACVVFENWQSTQVIAEYRTHIPEVAAYEPGAFYKRELPCLLAVLAEVKESLELCIVDGYVYFADEQDPALGAHLYQNLHPQIPVVGVAKNPFARAHSAIEIYRGESQQALYVTAAGVETAWAAEQVQTMAGNYRLPTLLKRVDSLCRQH